MVVRIAGKRMDLWRAVDHEGEILDVLVQRRRDRRAAVKLMRKRKQGFGQKWWSRISCAPTALPSGTSGFPVTMSRACDRTIGPRIRTRWGEDENASCSASNHRAPPSASSACMPLSTTHSTCSGILSLAQLFGSSDQMRLRNGAAQPPPHNAEPLRPISAETAQLDSAVFYDRISDVV